MIEPARMGGQSCKLIKLHDSLWSSISEGPPVILRQMM